MANVDKKSENYGCPWKQLTPEDSAELDRLVVDGRLHRLIDSLTPEAYEEYFGNRKNVKHKYTKEENAAFVQEMLRSIE